MNTLDELRHEIDAADKDLLEAFGRRLDIAKRIGEVKRAEGKPVYDESREISKIARLEEMASFEARPYVKELYQCVMNTAKDLEERPLFGVLGRSIPHTYSPEIHSLITTDYAYAVIEREEEELGQLWEQGRSGVYGGFNVTIPYKKKAYELCDQLTEGAKIAGAVNTVVFRPDGTALGANTDIYGFKYMMKSAGINPAGKSVIILGTGGASTAVNIALLDLGALRIRFVSRSGLINYDNVYDECSDAQIVVNTTPVGMFPEIDRSPVDLSRFKNLEAVADVIYNPSVTRFLYDAQNLGLKTCGGLKMLTSQAVKASAFFRGAGSDDEAESSIDEEEIERVTNLISRRMKNITIIGMPGSGKTWLSRELGVHLGREVVDLDLVYKDRFGKTCAQTLEEEGESVFRERETRIAYEYLSKSGLVISCGGGVVVREDNFFPLRCNSRVIYNKRPLEVLSMNNRPLSRSKGPEKLYEERREAYESLSDVTIEVPEMDTREEFLKEAIRQYDENNGN